MPFCVEPVMHDDSFIAFGKSFCFNSHANE